MTTTINFTATSHLQVLRNPVGTYQDGVDIVLIPGIGTTSPEKWPFADEGWPSSLPVNPGTCYDFLRRLSDARSQYELRDTNRPILVILGTTSGKDLEISSTTIAQEGAILVGLADRFEAIEFQTPILSAYELRESEFSPAPLRQLVNNREACSTRAPLETVFGLNLNHHDMCLFTKSTDGEGLPELRNFIYDTMQDAENLVSRRLDEQEYEHTMRSAYSPTVRGLLPDFERVGHTEWPSNGATEGTSLSGFELVHPTSPNMETRETVRIPCSLLNIRLENGDFFGREDVLARLAAELLPSKNMTTASRMALQQISLCGFGGIGKTEISREFCRRHRASFDAVFWVVADEIAKLDHQYQQISLALGLETPERCKSKVVSREIVKGWLSNPRKELSGTDKSTQQGPATLEASWLLIFDNADDPMILADYWPQGSRQAWILAQDLTLSEFFELYTDHEECATIYGTKFDTNLVTYRHSLSTVWAFEKLKPQARRLLEIITFLDPDVIKEDLLMEVSEELLSEGNPCKKANYIDARTDLLQSSLVQRDKRNKQLSIHRTIQDVVLTTIDVSKKQLLFEQIVRLLWAEWPSAMPKPSKEPNLPQPKSVGGRLHVARWSISIPNHSEASRLLFAKLLSEAAWYQKERGRTKSFDGFFETALSICKSSTHTDRDSLLADIYFCLGSIAMDTSDFDTSRFYKELSFNLVFEICTKLGTEDERLYLAYAERGISRIQDKRYDEGEADLKEALRMRKSFGTYIPRSGEANLSWALLAQGKFEECNMLLLNSLAGREKALGKNDRESARTGLILYVLGNLRATQEQWDESFADFYTANVSHKISEHLIRLGRKEEAIAVINEALDIWSVDPSAHKNEIARTTFLKGKLFENMGKMQKASVAIKIASRLRKKIAKEDRDAKTLTRGDFDEIVAFWAR
ncbi:tetratricopeptide repeat domain-containing protein [Paecilomyces variotii No. 5]|uniref:Tetratricopeptide repeat domain-containing protein n=1 Tax=Byssochlamys spectabilis (strain No. 5 / NBRC 109023) TaxID=1356009 RepID=V5FF54_BYSSN|nr:tetratricopeptide repeat domain-containing protein [Paecilomyces variotii No. 5]